jgi:PAS domain S-box-containing protein
VIREFIRNRRLEESLALSVALLVVVLLGATMMLVHSSMATSLRTEMEARGFAIARSIGAVATPSLLAYNYAALQIAAEGASEDDGVVYVVIHDKEGEVAGFSGHAELTAEARRPVRSPGSAQVQVHDKNGFETVLELAMPVRVEGVDEPWGMVRVGLSYGPVTAELQRVDLRLALVGLALALMAVASGRWIARRIAAPLRRLAEGTEALSAGDTSHRIPVTGPREIAELARSFNVMMDRIRDKAEESEAFQRALEKLNSTLEEQVNERTLALQASEAQYKTLVEHSPDSILIVQGGRVRFVNRAFVETFGVSEEEACSEEFDLDRILDPSSANLARGRISAWERDERVTSIEVLGKDRSGRVRHLELRGSRIEYRGSPSAECLLVDRTEARRLRERLNEAEKLRALGELAGGVAHDFNNLLGAILGRVQLMRRREFEDGTDRELAIIEKAAQDGRETVRRIQEFSRVRRDRQFTVVDVGEVIRDSVEITRGRWSDDSDRRNVRTCLAVEIDGKPEVLGNASELREVFTNLILNAVDAMPQGGKLELTCRRIGDRVVATVSDGGVGMTDEIRRHVFDPFFTTKGHSGMGLGMSVVYGIVTRHGGAIEVETTLGEGTTFVVELPMAPAHTEVRGGDGAALPHLVRPCRILVIDDEPEIAELLEDILTGEGHTVKTAVNGTDGVKLAALSDYDLVITDLGMPDISGWEVARRIRGRSPDLPVVLVTGWGATLDADEVRGAGIAQVVHKPFDVDEILQATSLVLGSADSGVEGSDGKPISGI